MTTTSCSVGIATYTSPSFGLNATPEPAAGSATTSVNTATFFEPSTGTSAGPPFSGSLPATEMKLVPSSTATPLAPAPTGLVGGRMTSGVLLPPIATRPASLDTETGLVAE